MESTNKDITRQAVERQINALKSDLYEVGVLFYNGEGPQMRTWTKGGLLDSVGWLKRQNVLGGNISIRPKGEHQYSIIDDLTQQGLNELNRQGYNPCCVVKTSENNFHAWVNHGKVLPAQVSTEAAKELAKQFAGDPGAANWRHFGRLAGFTNRKPKHLQANGLYPFCELVSASGKAYEQAGAFVQKIETKVAEINRERELRRVAYEVNIVNPNKQLKSIEAFRNDPRWGGDAHREDRAFAVWAVSHGIPEVEIKQAILSRPDIAKKGDQRRQLDYAKRTIAGARAYRADMGVGI